MDEFDFIDKIQAELERIMNLRFRVMDDLEVLLAEVEKSEYEMPDFIWQDIGLEFFLLRRFEQARDAMLKAVAAAEKAKENGEENFLRSSLGDLSMVYEHMGDYSEAVKLAKRSLDLDTRDPKTLNPLDLEMIEISKRRLEKLKKIEPALS